MMRDYMLFPSNYLRYLTVLLFIVTLCTACQRPNYRVDTREAATLTFYAFRIFRDEQLQVLVNGKEVLFDTTNALKDRHYYLRYLNPDMKAGTSVAFKSYYKGSLLIDTSFKVTDKSGRHSLSLSAPYPANIPVDSLRRMKIPFKYDSLSIGEARRMALFEPDTGGVMYY